MKILKIFYLSLAFIFATTITACKKENNSLQALQTTITNNRAVKPTKIGGGDPVLVLSMPIIDNIKEHSAIMHSHISIEEAKGIIVKRGAICYEKEDDVMIIPDDATAGALGFPEGPFAIKLEGLKSGTEYHVAAYANTPAQFLSFHSREVTFKTAGKPEDDVATSK